MSSRANKAQASLVRSFLKNLPDVPNSEGSSKRRTMQSVAVEHEVEVSKLRQFRDGKDAALSKSLVTTWAKLLGTDVDAELPSDPLDRTWYKNLLECDHSRLGRYKAYATIDETRPEAARALDCWSDIVCTGSVGEDRYGGGFEPNYMGDKAREKKLLNVISQEINTHILPPSELLMLARDLAKDGDVFEQVVLGKQGGQNYIARLVNMPTSTMFYERKDDGSIDPARAFRQQLPNQTQPSAFFAQHEIVHFCNKYSRADLYGRSIFWSSLRSHIQIEALEAGMMIRRLERAPFRLKHKLDVSHCASQKEIEDAIGRAQERNKKVRTIDGNRNFHMQRISMPADQDLFVALRTPDSPADIEGIQGDANLDQIADFSHFWSKWLSGLGPPKAHLGYEADTMRSVGTELHVVFARMGRRMQIKVIKGLLHLYWLSLILRNLDPRTIPFTIYPPAVGTRDELLRAQVHLAHATVVRYLGQTFGATGKQPSVKWFLRFIMGLDDEVIDALDLEDVIQPSKGSGPGGSSQDRGGPSKSESEKLAEVAILSPEVQDAVFNTQFFINERAIALRKPELLKGGTAEQYEWLKPIDPFGASFEGIVRSCGKKLSDLKRFG